MITVMSSNEVLVLISDYFIHCDQISAQSGWDWPRMEQIGNFLDQISVHFGSILKSDLKKSRICPI